MKIKSYEGGIPYTVEIPQHIWDAAGRMPDLPCTCRGEAHDECRPCAECGEAPALNEVQDDPEGGTMSLCDDCWEALVEEEERAFNEARAEQEMLDNEITWMREDHEAMKFDAWWQAQKEEGWNNE